MSERTFTVAAFGRPDRGFCRGGFHWPALGATNTLTAAQLDRLKGERKVGITEIDGVAYKAPPIAPSKARTRLPFDAPPVSDSAKEIADLKAKLGASEERAIGAAAKLAETNARLASVEKMIEDLNKPTAPLAAPAAATAATKK